MLCSQVWRSLPVSVSTARCERSTSTAPVSAGRCSPRGSPKCQIAPASGPESGAGTAFTRQLYGSGLLRSVGGRPRTGGYRVVHIVYGGAGGGFGGGCDPRQG